MDRNVVITDNSFLIACHYDFTLIFVIIDILPMAASIPDLSNATPEDMAIILGQVQQAYANKDQKVKELQNIQKLLLNMQNFEWITKRIPQEFHDVRRTADTVTDDTHNLVILRKVESYPLAIWSYEVPTDQWQINGACPVYRCSMVYYGQQLIIIGGATTREDKAPRSRKVLHYTNNEWTRCFPDMPTGRSRMIALTCDYQGAKVLIVIGGEDDSDASLKTVEIVDMTDPSNGWQKAHDIPETLCSSSGTIAGGYIYVLGGWSKRNNPSSAAFRCTVDALIKSIIQPDADNPWETLPELPVEEATCTSFHDTLIVVGGRANSVAVHDIRTYNPHLKRWDVISYLPHPRYICFAIGLPDKLVVIGGKKDTTTKENTIEILQQVTP